MREEGARIPDLLDRLDRLPQAMPHGDATPQDLLVTADAPDTFVAIDVSFRSPHEGFTTSALVRRAFDGLPYRLPGSEDPVDRRTLEERLALSRFLLAQHRAWRDAR